MKRDPDNPLWMFVLISRECEQLRFDSLTNDYSCALWQTGKQPVMCRDMPAEPEDLMGLEGVCGFYFEAKEGDNLQ